MWQRDSFLLLILAIPLAGACASDDGGEASADVRTVTGLVQCSVAVEGYSYLAALLPYTGSLSDKALSRERAVELAVRQINAEGGVHGHTLGLVSCDTCKEESATVAVAAEVAGSPLVFGVVGPSTSANVLAAASVFRERGLAAISPSATSPAIRTLEDDGFVFRTAVSDAAQGRVLAVLAGEEGLEEVLVVHRSDAYGDGLRDRFVQAFTEAGGQMEALAYDEGTLDAEAIAQQIEARAPQAVLLIAYVGDAAAILRSTLDAGVQTRWLLTDGTRDPGLLEKIGGGARLEGALGTSPLANSGPEATLFHDAYAQAWGEEPLAYAANAYDAAWLLAMAAELADDPDLRVQVRDRLADTWSGAGLVRPGEWGAFLDLIGEAGVDYLGASGPVDLDAAGDVEGNLGVWAVQQGEIVEIGCRQADGSVCAEE